MCYYPTTATLNNNTLSHFPLPPLHHPHHPPTSSFYPSSLYPHPHHSHVMHYHFNGGSSGHKTYPSPRYGAAGASGGYKVNNKKTTSFIWV